MLFADFVAAVEATLLAEHHVELRRARFGDGRVDWFVGSMEVRLEVDAIESVALSASIAQMSTTPMSYPMTFRSVRGVARDLAALVDLPESTAEKEADPN